MTVEEAGAELGLGRSAAYEAAARGQLPTISMGRRKVVPTAALRRLLSLDDDDLDQSAPATPPANVGTPAVILPFDRGRRLNTSP